MIPPEVRETSSARRVFLFLRAPMMDTRADVQSWLEERGFLGGVIFRGPDGSCRGSGVIELGSGASDQLEIGR